MSIQPLPYHIHACKCGAHVSECKCKSRDIIKPLEQCEMCREMTSQELEQARKQRIATPRGGAKNGHFRGVPIKDELASDVSRNGKMQICSHCNDAVQFMFEGRCRNCYYKEVVAPLISEREKFLAKVSELDTRIAFETRRFSPTVAKAAEWACQRGCGKRFNYWMGMLEHMESCTFEPTPKQQKQAEHVARRARLQSIENV